MSDKNNPVSEGDVGAGIIYGASISGMATFSYVAVTGDRSALILGFIEAGLVLVGVARSMRYHGLLGNQKPKPSGPNGPGS